MFLYLERKNILTNLIGAARKQQTPSFNIRWLMWIFLIMLHLVTSFHRVSFNVAAEFLTAEFALTGAGLGNLAAAYTYMYVLMQIPGGILVDHLGPRKIALITGLSMAAGSILIGYAPTAAWIFIGRMLIGLGGSVVLINILKFQASWFRFSEFASLSGFALLISTSGSLLAATPLVYSIATFGWRSSFIYFGLLTVLVAVLCWTVVRNQPQDNGAATVLGQDDQGDHDQSAKINRQAIKSVFANRRIWIPFLCNFGLYGGFIVFVGTWGVSYLVHVYNFSLEQASSFMIVANLGFMVGAPLSGVLSDYYGSRKIPELILILSAVSFWLALLLWPGGIIPTWLLYCLCVLIGFGGVGTIVTFSIARDVSGPGYTGLVTATVNLGVFLGLAIMQPLFGYVLDRGWQGLIIDGVRIYPLEAYRVGFLICLLFTIVALGSILSYREKRIT